MRRPDRYVQTAHRTICDSTRVTKCHCAVLRACDALISRMSQHFEMKIVKTELVATAIVMAVMVVVTE